MAAGQGGARDDRPTSRPRTPGRTIAPSTWPGCARRSSRRSAVAPGRPTCRCPTGWATGGTTAAPTRTSSTARAAGAPSRAPTTGRPRSSRWTSRSPASRCWSTPTSSPQGHDFFSLGGVSVSPDGHLLAFSTDIVGDERYHAPGQGPPHRRAAARRGAEHPRRRDLGPSCGTTLFYSTVDDAWRPDKLWRHVLGTPVADDVLVHHETDEKYWTGIGRTRSDRFLVRASGSKTTTEYAVLEADDPTGEFRVVAPRRQGVEYSVEHAVLKGEDCLLVPAQRRRRELHARGGPGRRHLARADWRPLLPYDPAVRLEDVDAFATHLVVSQRSEGLTQLRVDACSTTPPRTVSARTSWSSSTRRCTPSGRAATRSSPSRRSGSATRR